MRILNEERRADVVLVVVFIFLEALVGIVVSLAVVALSFSWLFRWLF